jgi:histidinol-phosphate aminotransferase
VSPKGTRPRPRSDLEGLAPYSTSDSAKGRIFLHANENPYPLPEEVMNEILEATTRLELNRYPDTDSSEVARELAEYAGVDPEWIWIGDGSNEVLLQSCLAYGGPGRKALVFEPTYRMHFRQARMAGTAVEISARRSDFTIDVDAAVQVIDRVKPDIVFLCSPNNPTGTVTPAADLIRIASATHGLVIADEAYFEFCGDTLVPKLGELANVIVVRTMSKAFRLAGLRLGYGIANPDLLESMRPVRMPYAQSSFTQAAALVVLRRRDEVLDKVDAIVGERYRIARELGKVAEVFPSGANFVLFRPSDAAALLEALTGRGIVVRDFRSLAGTEGCLRVTVGLESENDEFLATVSGVSGR